MSAAYSQFLFGLMLAGGAGLSVYSAVKRGTPFYAMCAGMNVFTALWWLLKGLSA